MAIARSTSRVAGALASAAILATSGCVTHADHEKLRKRVSDLERGGGSASASGGGSRERLADLAAQIAKLEQENAELRGRVEVSEHRVDSALEEARAARKETARIEARIDGASGAPSAPDVGAGEEGVAPAELQAYREAYAAWRGDEPGVCIDRFRNFLQTYPSSPYADDAAYWMADCYFKQGDFKTAVLRFDDVVNRYPTGNKAPDALYRQGEALLRMGPGYGSAAGKAFERVLKEYPESSRAAEAKRQLDLLKSG
jgi:tol-pal system protein YbgF